MANSLDNSLFVIGFVVSLIGVIVATGTSCVMARKFLQSKSILTGAVLLSNVSCLISCLANLINFAGYSPSCEVYMWFGGSFWGSNVLYSVIAMNERARCIRGYPKWMNFLILAMMTAMLVVLIYTRIISPGLVLDNNICAALWNKKMCLTAIYPLKMAMDVVINSFFILELRNALKGLPTSTSRVLRAIFLSAEIRLILMFVFDICSIVIGMTSLDEATDLLFYIATMWVDSFMLTCSVFAKDISEAVRPESSGKTVSQTKSGSRSDPRSSQTKSPSRSEPKSKVAALGPGEC